MITCNICNKDFKSYQSLGNHIRHSHKDTNSKEYYIKFISKNNEHLCPICGKENKFYNLNLGFAQACSRTCGQKNPITRKKLKDTNIKKYGVENPFQNEEVQNKQKQTLLNKYGVDHNFKHKETKDKYKQTMIEKYGHDNMSKIAEFQIKKKETFISKYGVDNPNKSEIIKNKIKALNLEKYGVEYSLQSELVKQKSRATNLEKYGFEQSAKNSDIKDKILKTRINKYGSVNLYKIKQFRDKAKRTCINKYGVSHHLKSDIVKDKIKNTNIQRYGFENYSQSNNKQIQTFDRVYNSFLTTRLKNRVIPKFDRNEYIGTKGVKYKFECVKCNSEFNSTIENGRVPSCPVCYPRLHGRSKLELDVVNYIRSKTDAIIEESNRSILSNKQELDIYIPSKNIAIEFNGLYWHSESNGKGKDYHITKTMECEANNVQLIHIFEDEWINKPEIVKSIISAKLGLITNKIYARNCDIKKVNIVDALDYLDENHIQGKVYGENYGLYHNNELVCMITVGKSRYNNNYRYEILRFCNKLEMVVIGGFGKLFKYIMNLNKYKTKSIISYADMRYSNGNLYKKSGFNLIGKSSPSYYYLDDFTHRYSRLKFQKHKLQNILESYDKNLTEWQNMQINGYDRIWDCGNLVFEYKL